MNSTEALLQKTEADILEAFERFGTQFETISDLAHRVAFSHENSQQVKSFFNALTSMELALHALVQATRTVAEIKGVDFS